MSGPTKCLHNARGPFPAGHGQLANTISPEFMIDNLTWCLMFFFISGRHLHFTWVLSTSLANSIFWTCPCLNNPNALLLTFL